MNTTDGSGAGGGGSGAGPGGGATTPTGGKFNFFENFVSSLGCSYLFLLGFFLFCDFYLPICS